MRLPWLGPAIVITGLGVGGLGIWYWRHVQPVPGPIIDVVPIDSGEALVLRAEQGTDRSFIELRAGSDEVRWQALIPHYAGAAHRPAVAWGPSTVTVRVARDGHAEVFGFARRDSAKIGGFTLSPEHEPITTQPDGPLTLTDHVRSYELTGGPTWHELTAIDIGSGKGAWRRDLGAAPITDGGVDGAALWLVQDGHKRWFDAVTGADKSLN